MKEFYLLYLDEEKLRDVFDPSALRWQQQYIYYDRDKDKLYCETLNLFEVILRKGLGYKKRFNRQNFWQFFKDHHWIDSSIRCPPRRQFRKAIAQLMDRFIQSKKNFFSLIESESCDEVELIDLFKQGLDVNVCHKNCTGLQAAIEHNYPNLAIYLILNGAKTYFSLKNHATLLHLLAEKVFSPRTDRHFYHQLIHMLSFYGYTGIDTKDRDGLTPLHYAVDNQNIFCTSLLLEMGAFVNAQDADGLTALHYTAKTPLPNQVDIALAKILLEHGADAGTQDDFGRTPLYYAVANGDVPMVKLLLNYVGEQDFSRREDCSLQTYGDALLCLAAETLPDDDRSLSIVEDLLNKGISLHSIQSSCTALHCAIAKNKYRMVERFLKKGFLNYLDGTAKDDLVAKAISIQSLSMLKLLFKSGITLPKQLAKWENGSVLHIHGNQDPALDFQKPTWMWDEQILELLIAMGADVNAIDNLECRPLDIAVACGDEKAASILISHGAKHGRNFSCKKHKSFFHSF
jgi:ankyrin repeat protein